MLTLIREACEDKKGEETVVLDLRTRTSLANYFVIASGTSDRHARAIADNVVDSLKQHKIPPLHVEGLQESRWILIDAGEVIVHVFHNETRQFYNLERLWGNVPRL